MERIDELLQGRVEQQAAAGNTVRRAEPSVFRPAPDSTLRADTADSIGSAFDGLFPTQDGAVTAQDHSLLTPQEPQRVPPSGLDTNRVQTVQFNRDAPRDSKLRISERAKRLLHPLLRRGVKSED